MDALRVFELTAKASVQGTKAGRAYVRAIRQAYRDVIHADDLLADGYEKLAADPEFQAEMLAARRRERLVEREAEQEVSEPRMECDGPDAAETFDVAGLKVTRASLDELGDSLQRITDAERSAFRSGGQTYETGLRPRISTPPVPSSSAGRGVGSPGVSAGAEEPAPPGKRPTPGEFAAVAVREVLAAHHPWEGAGGIECSPESADFEHPYSADHLLHFADKYDWREHVATEIQRRIDAGVGATPTPADIPEKFEHWFQK